MRWEGASKNWVSTCPDSGRQPRMSRRITILKIHISRCHTYRIWISRDGLKQSLFSLIPHRGLWCCTKAESHWEGKKGQKADKEPWIWILESWIWVLVLAFTILWDGAKYCLHFNFFMFKIRAIIGLLTSLKRWLWQKSKMVPLRAPSSTCPEESMGSVHRRRELGDSAGCWWKRLGPARRAGRNTPRGLEGSGWWLMQWFRCELIEHSNGEALRTSVWPQAKSIQILCGWKARQHPHLKITPGFPNTGLDAWKWQEGNEIQF